MEINKSIFKFTGCFKDNAKPANRIMSHKYSIVSTKNAINECQKIAEKNNHIAFGLEYPMNGNTQCYTTDTYSTKYGKCVNPRLSVGGPLQMSVYEKNING